MAARTRIFAANWKMHKVEEEVESFIQEFCNYTLPPVEEGRCRLVFFPPHPYLHVFKRLGGAMKAEWGAQNMYHEDKGAFTGEVAPPMLLDMGCRWVLLGHSERRGIFGETDAMVKRKVDAALSRGLRPMVCVGETLEERESGVLFDKVGAQVDAVLEGLGADEAGRLAFAYEPIWAIGTGRNADGGQAEEMIAFIRSRVARKAGEAAASSIPVLYGGSVKPHNIAEFTSREEVDGALVGGASLDPASFRDIVLNGMSAR